MITEKMRAIADILGCQFPEQGEHFSMRLDFDWDGTLFLEEFQGRLHITSRFPSGNGWFWGPSPNPHKISVAASKSAEQIARDIEHRLLREYKAAYLDAVARMNEHEQAQAKRAALAKKLAGILGIAEASIRDPLQFRQYGPVDIGVTVNSADVSLKIRCGDELAEFILVEMQRAILREGK